MKLLATVCVGMALIADGGVWITYTGSAHAESEANATAREAGDDTKGTPLQELATVYTLADDENLRRIKTPYPEQRATYADEQYPYAHGSKNIRSLGFSYAGGRLAGMYMRYPDPTLSSVIDNALRIPWYNLDHLDRITWKPGTSDWIVRAGLSIDDRLAALAKIISEDTKKSLKFESKKVSRPCIVLKGKVRPAPQNAGHFNVVVVTLETLNVDELQEWIDGKAPKNKVDKYPDFQFQGPSKILDAPFFDQTGNISGIGSLFYIGTDAHLDRTQPGYEDKLKKVLKNIEDQVGGDWSVEEREIETWEPIVG